MSYQSVKALLAKGVSRPTLFEITMPNRYFDKEANDQMRFLCKTAMIPEVAIDTISVNGHEALGIRREQGALVTYSRPLSLNIISDRDYTVYKAFRTWFDQLALNANPDAGAFRNPANLNLLGGNIGKSQRMSYYQVITEQITLKKLEQGKEEKYFSPFEITFNNAFPVAVGQLSLDTEARDSYMDFDVQLTFDHYSINTDPVEEVDYEPV